MSGIPRSLIHAATSILIAATVGCADASAPDRIPAVVVLVDVDGSPPPVLPHPSSTRELLADTITLLAHGAGARHLTLRRLEDDVVVAAEISVRWETEGGVLRVYHWCPPNGIVPCPTEPDLAGPIRAEVWSVTDGIYFNRPARYRVLERLRGLP
ncbi:MAG: hypothetical protein ACKVS7_00795 [Gemmatimonadaceae bacterium]